MASFPCPNCGRTVEANRLNWSELNYERLHGEGDIAEGPEQWGEIKYYRRFRECSSCRKTFVTAEVDEQLLPELLKLREILLKMNNEGRSLAAAAGRINRLTRRN
jgi:hypothetical protein